MIHILIVFHQDLKINKKQSLILCPGLPRSGTTSLWHMLREAKVFDIDWKEPHFLSVLSDDKTDLPTFSQKNLKIDTINMFII